MGRKRRKKVVEKHDGYGEEEEKNGEDPELNTQEVL